MECANTAYLTLDGVRAFREGVSRIPSYQEAKALPPLVVDDALRVRPSSENLALVDRYCQEGFQLVPIRRQAQRDRSANPGFPARILLEITSKCNMNCVMCPRTVLRRPQIHMPKDLVRRCIDEIDAHGVEGLWLYNIGESMLHPHFQEIVDYCRQKNLGSLWLSTNGQHVPDDMMETVLRSQLTFLNYSLNAMRAETYKLICPNGDYDRLLANLERLLAKKRSLNRMGSPPWVRIQMIEQPQVVSEIDWFLRDYATKGELLSVNVLEGFNQSVAPNVCFAKGRERPQRTHCNRIMRGDCFIFADGEVSFCDTDFNHEMSIGNVRDATIEAIWTGERHRSYTSLNAAGRLDEVPMCRQCLDYDL